jgi:cytochrome b
MATTRVWDAFVRVFHWSLVASFAVAWLSGEDWKSLHIWAGYAAAALIALRLVWGLIGTHYARFSQVVRPPPLSSPAIFATWRPAEKPATSVTTRRAAR